MEWIQEGHTMDFTHKNEVQDKIKYVDYVFNTFKYPSNVDCLSNVDFYAMVHPR